jgi:hypothetical protein
LVMCDFKNVSATSLPCRRLKLRALPSTLGCGAGGGAVSSATIAGCIVPAWHRSAHRAISSDSGRADVHAFFNQGQPDGLACIALRMQPTDIGRERAGLAIRSTWRVDGIQAHGNSLGMSPFCEPRSLRSAMSSDEKSSDMSASERLLAALRTRCRHT